MAKDYDLQPPFRDQDLMPVQEFIDHCRRCGVSTSPQELEFFEKERLVFPAVRVKRRHFTEKNVQAKTASGKIIRAAIPEQSVRFRNQQIEGRTWQGENVVIQKTAPRSYYHVLGHSIVKGWLERPEREQRIVYPARSKFKPWSTYTVANIVTNQKALKYAWSTYYTPDQVFILPKLQDIFSLTLSNEQLFLSEQAWLESRQKAQHVLKKYHPKSELQKEISEHYCFFALLNNIRDIVESIRPANVTQTLFANDPHSYSGPNLSEDVSDELQLDIKAKIKVARENLSNQAQKVLSKHGVSIQHVRLRQQAILGYGSFKPGDFATAHRLQYLEQLNDDTLQSEYPYQVVTDISEFLRLLGEKALSLKHLILGDFVFHCRYCGKPAKMRGSQIPKTCGEPECRKAYMREHNARARRSR